MYEPRARSERTDAKLTPNLPSFLHRRPACQKPPRGYNSGLCWPVRYDHEGGYRHGGGMNQEYEALTPIDESLLADMRCPLSHAKLVQCGDWLYTTDPDAPRKYPIQNGIPVMLIDAGVAVDHEEFVKAVGGSGDGPRNEANE